MVHTDNEIEKIASYKTWSDNKKLDRLLEMDCKMYCYLGSDSTKGERNDVRRASKRIYSSIKKIDNTLGTLLLQSMDPSEILNNI
jgi:hypothetical protein